MSISSDTMVAMNLGTIAIFVFYYGKAIMAYAEMKLKLEFAQKSLDALHSKIREQNEEIKELRNVRK